MSNSHGDLFTEIGQLVLAANSGVAIDLGVTTKDLASRYEGLGIPEEIIAKVVSRSIGAVSFSLAQANSGLQGRLEVLRENEAAHPTAVPPEKQGTEPPSDEPPAANGSTEEMSAAEPKAKPKAAKTNGSGRRTRRSKKKTVAKSDASAAKGASLFPSGVKLAVIS